MSVGKLWRAAVVTMAVFGLHATVALAARPQFVSISVRPHTFRASGGIFQVSARVRNSRTCRIDAEPLRSRRLDNCASGHITLSGHVPANTTAIPIVWSFGLEAYGGSHTGYSRNVQVEVLPNEPTPPRLPAPPPAHSLDACTPGPECDYLSAYESFQSWGNVAPEPLGDCTFAAAANWEQIVLGVQANPTLIGYEYAKAGGTENGLTQNALWSYWRSDGVAGVHLTGLHSYSTTRVNVENGVRDYRAMIAELSFQAGWGFGPYAMPNSRHEVVVDGFTPEGPLVVSWGETLQMTWEQWDDEATEMWGIEAS